MKALLAALLVLCSVSGASAARYDGIPLPPVREQPAPIVVAQAQTNPDPFNRERVANTPAPVVVQAPSADTSITGWSQTGLLGVLAALMAKLALFNKSAPASPSAPVPSTPVSFQFPSVDPGIRASIDTAALQLIEGGAPGEAIKLVIGFIPGAAPFAPTIERALRALSVKVLQGHIPPTTNG